MSLLFKDSEGKGWPPTCFTDAKIICYRNTEMLKPANSGRAWGEDRTLPIAVDGLEKSEMKERSEIKPDASPNAMSTKPVVSKGLFLMLDQGWMMTPMAFLERIRDDFVWWYGGKIKTVTAPHVNSLNRDFSSKLKKHMQYCVDHPVEISMLAKVKNILHEAWRWHEDCSYYGCFFVSKMEAGVKPWKPHQILEFQVRLSMW